MNPEVSITTVLEERTPKKDGTYPVKLRITHRRNQRYFNTGISVSIDDFEKMMTGKPRGDLKESQLFVNAYEQRAVAVIDTLRDFSFDEFKKIFSGDKEKSKSLSFLFEQYISDLKKEGRIGTANSYTSASNSIQIFSGKKNLLVTDVNPDFLKRYEKKMIGDGSSSTTVGIYLRSLRTIMNVAKSKGIIKELEYPFGRYKYVIPSGKNIKKAISKIDIQSIFDYTTESSMEERAKDFWILSYMCNGINMKDIALLKNKNIKAGMVHFIRAKTENTSRTNLKPISVYMTADIKRIIKTWGGDKNSADDYVFPIIDGTLNIVQQRKTISQFIKTTNKYLNRIADNIGLNYKLTTYTARHSYATLLKRSGVPLAYISDSLGHKDLKTTENYLDGFEDSVKKQYSSLLTNFLKPENGKRAKQNKRSAKFEEATG